MPAIPTIPAPPAIAIVAIARKAEPGKAEVENDDLDT